VAKARGSTLWITFDKDPARKRPYAVCWHVYAAGQTGRPKQKSRWFATPAEAEAFKAEVLIQLATPDAAVTTVIANVPKGSVTAVAEAWLSEIEPDKAKATIRSYRSLLATHIAPDSIGRTICATAYLTAPVFKQFYKRLEEAGVSLATRRHIHGCLSSFCTYAKGEGLLVGENPCFDLGRSLRKRKDWKADPQPNPFTVEEVARFFDQLEACEPDYWVRYFQFLHDTGVRVGEAAGLKWATVDLDARAATIEASYSPAEQGDKSTKTGQTRRIELTSRVVEQLLAWAPEQRREAFRRGRPCSAYVFTTRRGARQRQDGNMRRVFDRVCEAVGIAGHTPHDLRDTFATSHLVDAWDRKLAWVSKQLGHATPTTTANHYYAYRPTTAALGFADDIRVRR
jgi:integrase